MSSENQASAQIASISGKVDLIVTTVGTSATDLAALTADVNAWLQGQGATTLSPADKASLDSIASRLDGISTNLGTLDAAIKSADPGQPVPAAVNG